MADKLHLSKAFETCKTPTLHARIKINNVKHLFIYKFCFFSFSMITRLIKWQAVSPKLTALLATSGLVTNPWKSMTQRSTPSSLRRRCGRSVVWNSSHQRISPVKLCWRLWGPVCRINTVRATLARGWYTFKVGVYSLYDFNLAVTSFNNVYFSTGCSVMLAHPLFLHGPTSADASLLLASIRNVQSFCERLTSADVD